MVNVENGAHVVVVGTGKLGGRHLQALARLSDVRITVVEPSEESFRNAKQWFDAAGAERKSGKPPEVRHVQRLSADVGSCDVAIVATSANVRAELVNELLTGRTVRYMVLEKVLFQRLSDYPRMAARIAQAGTKTWVNCPRRMWSLYREWAGKHGPDTPLSLTVTGSSWGLATSTVHFMDLLALLTGENEALFDTSGLLPGGQPSARAGFVDLFGTLDAVTPSGHRMRLTSLPGTGAPMQVDLFSAQLRARIREYEGMCSIAQPSSEWRSEATKFQALFQSQLSDRIVDDLLLTGRCDLTPLADSMQHHLSFISAALAHLGLSQEDACPVT